ncbi:putative transmembrane protein [Gregarina niphandrodes]|uniref:Transmembrane protein n=1 Tax=Gregarina niphandrodes TaxID=110365 RepID=A0A023B457_GRENI|nr:putative transmembrane protein [Gregarina niphandrodes]EZG56267.1 putative transmembrane protein [Gregarina niphandrodes]|eukprot:XP_011131302.1 putative transmembrane protein [Gregarina niphandrodes]
MLTLGDRTGKAGVQFLAAAPKEAMKKFVEAAKEDATLAEEVIALNEDRNFYWLEMCSRIFMYSPYGPINTLGEALAMRDLRQYFEAIDPDGEFSHVSDQICSDSVGRPMSELERALTNVSDCDDETFVMTASLKVIDCRRLTPEEVVDARSSLPEEWLPLLAETTRDSDVECGLSWGSTRYIPSRCCLIASAISAGAVVVGGAFAGLIYALLTHGNSPAVSLLTSDRLQESTVKRMFDTNSTASYNTSNVTDAFTDFVATVAMNVTNGTLLNIIRVAPIATTTVYPTGSSSRFNTTTMTETLLNTTDVTPTELSTTTTTAYPTRFGTWMTESKLNELQTVESTCQKLFNSLGYKTRSLPVMDADAGRYPCGGGSGQLLCATPQNNAVGTCYHFGGPWTYEAFAVKEAIGHYLQDGRECVVRCDGEEEALRNLWEVTQKSLLSISPYPGRGFLKFTNRVSVPNLNDFEAMMRPRYPVEENCSGSCVDCVEDTGTRKCSCNFARVKCQVRTKAEQQENKIELVAYNEDPRFLFGLLSPFSKKKDVYQVVGCDYECRKASPDVAVPASVRFLETEPAGDGSPLKLRLSRRELSKLQLPLAQCEGYDTDDWHPLEEIGRYPCWGGSGVMMCKVPKINDRCSKWWPFACKKYLPVSCHRFGPVWIDVFAVENTVRYHSGEIGDCFVKCDDKDVAMRHLWKEANDSLQNASRYEPQPISSTENLELQLQKWYPAERSCSSTCGSDLQSCTNIRNCVCRAAHVKCRTELKDGKDQQVVESWGFNTRINDVLGMMSIPGANGKINHTKTEDTRTHKCHVFCHEILWSPTPPTQVLRWNKAT